MREMDLRSWRGMQGDADGGHHGLVERNVDGDFLCLPESKDVDGGQTSGTSISVNS